MKKIVLFLFYIICIQQSQAKKVRFAVDMSQYTILATGVHVFGDFQQVAGYGPDWTSYTCLMTQSSMDTNIYYFTVDIPAFAKYEYKFINGDQSYEVEIVPEESQVGYNFDDNRWIYIDSLDNDTLKLPPLRFNENCASGQTMIRFLVDMSKESINANGIHVKGDFQGNDPNATRLYSFGNDIYEVIGYMNTGMQHFNFVNGNSNADVETISGACTMGSYRMVTLNNDIVLSKVCYASCDSCISVGINDISWQNKITFKGNPIRQTSWIQFEDLSNYHHIAIFDMQGRILRKYLNVKETMFPIEKGTLASGNYVLKIMNDKNQRWSMNISVD
ncbi:MAG: hypothetical protein R2831_08405 [Chitinophagaceae bacterium]